MAALIMSIIALVVSVCALFIVFEVTSAVISNNRAAKKEVTEKEEKNEKNSISGKD